MLSPSVCSQVIQPENLSISVPDIFPQPESSSLKPKEAAKNTPKVEVQKQETDLSQIRQKHTKEKSSERYHFLLFLNYSC